MNDYLLFAKQLSRLNITCVDCSLHEEFNFTDSIMILSAYVSV